MIRILTVVLTARRKCTGQIVNSSHGSGQLGVRNFLTPFFPTNERNGIIKLLVKLNK
jgi:hypothetical protein